MTALRNVCDKPLKQIRYLTHALILSGAFNILLLAFICYGLFGNGLLLVQESIQPRLPPSPRACSSKSLAAALKSIQKLSYEQLLTKLEDTRFVQGGYRERDLALAYFVWRYHFDLPRALGGVSPVPSRQLSIKIGGRVTQMPLFSNFSETHYQKIVHFAQTERWPLTSQGLFKALKNGPSVDEGLVEAFCLTPEFLTLQRSLSKSGKGMEKQQLFQLLLAFNWNDIIRATRLKEGEWITYAKRFAPH